MCYIIFKRKSDTGNRDWVSKNGARGVVRKSQLFHIKSYILIFNAEKDITVRMMLTEKDTALIRSKLSEVESNTRRTRW